MLIPKHKYRMATLNEVQSRVGVKRYEGVGTSRFYALDSLRLSIKKAKNDGYFSPKFVKDSFTFCNKITFRQSKLQWYCGKFRIETSSNKCFPEIVYNTIFWIELNDLVLCFTYL
jgi:hypothetical protein